jgi:hypothetical protein
MIKMIGLLLVTPSLAVAFILRLTVFVPFAMLFLVPVLTMRPRLLLRAPRMLRYMLMAKRGGMSGCGPSREWHERNLERSGEPVKL